MSVDSFLQKRTPKSPVWHSRDSTAQRNALKNFLIKVVLSLVLLGFVLYLIDLGMFWKTIRTADARFLLIAILLFFPVQLLAAYRWYFVLSHLNRFIPF